MRGLVAYKPVGYKKAKCIATFFRAASFKEHLQWLLLGLKEYDY